jgi:SAM-dependent methyltransferase
MTPDMPRRKPGEPAITPDELVSELRPGMAVLDAGCGSGSFKYAVHPDITISACDILPPTPFPDLPNVQYRQLAAENLDYPASSFDLVILNFVLEHAQDPSRILHLCHATLKPAGILYCSVPNSRHFEDRLFRAYDRFLKILTLKPFDRIEHIQRFTRENLASIALSVGLIPTTYAAVPAGFGWAHGPIDSLASSKGRIRDRLKAAICRIMLGWVHVWLGFYALFGRTDPRLNANILYTFAKGEPKEVGRDELKAMIAALPARIFTHSCGHCGLPILIEGADSPLRPHRWRCPRCHSLNEL